MPTEELNIKIINSHAYIGLRNYFCIDIDYEVNQVRGTLHIWYDSFSHFWRKQIDDNKIEDLVLKEWINTMENANFSYKNY